MLRRSLFLATGLISVLFMVRPVIGQTPMKPAASAVPTQATFVEQLKRTVIFIQTECSRLDEHGKQVLDEHGHPIIESRHAGTAFLLSRPDPRLDGGSFPYLVTNRHMAQPGIEDGKPCQPADYVLRIDSKTPNVSGSYSVIQTVLPGVLPWTYSNDPSDDLAIAPVGFDQNTLDVIFLPSTMLLSSADVAQNVVEEGDSVMFTGLFVQMAGQIHSEPIVREGKIAMMPREKVQTTLKALGDIYLVDCHVFGGNSGSPMLIDLAGARKGSITAGQNYKLLGVISGYVEEKMNFELHAVAAYAGTVDANSGVAIVVPAQKILDLLDSPGLRAIRDRTISALPKKAPH